MCRTSVLFDSSYKLIWDLFFPLRVVENVEPSGPTRARVHSGARRRRAGASPVATPRGLPPIRALFEIATAPCEAAPALRGGRRTTAGRRIVITAVLLLFCLDHTRVLVSRAAEDERQRWAPRSRVLDGPGGLGGWFDIVGTDAAGVCHHTTAWRGIRGGFRQFRIGVRRGASAGASRNLGGRLSSRFGLVTR